MFLYFPYQEQYSGIRDIFKKCFKLLQVMSRGNEAVQQRLFDRMDMLLSIQGAEGAMAEALTEVSDKITVLLPGNICFKTYHYFQYLGIYGWIAIMLFCGMAI